MLPGKISPQNEILEAPMSSHPSYAWRSLHQAIWINKKGSCWRIGNGHKVGTKEDKWLPLHNGFKLITPNLDSNFPLLVKDLLQNSPFDWIYHFLHDKLLPIDNSQISQLPIIHNLKDDELMWMYDKTENYTIKSGYEAIQLWKTRMDHDPSTSSLADLLENNSGTLILYQDIK